MTLPVPAPSPAPDRLRHTRSSRLALVVALAAALLALTGCSAEEAKHVAVLFMPAPKSNDAEYIAAFWDWMWLAAWVIGVIVWVLMAYVAIRYRRRSENDVPVQLRYHLPIEIFYTLVPVILVVVIFVGTVRTQDAVAADDNLTPEHTILVTAQKWSWTFNYEVEVDTQDKARKVTAGENTVFDTGTPKDPPTLYLPVGERTSFELRSPDVIHSFWVPAFLFKLDVIPGRPNHFALTPTEEGTFAGKCAELCGTYHSRMLFNVKVVSREEYDAHLKELAAQNSGFAPGSVFATEQAGLETGGTE